MLKFKDELKVLLLSDVKMNQHELSWKNNVIVEGMDIKSLEQFALDVIKQGFEVYGEKELCEEIVESYDEDTLQNLGADSLQFMEIQNIIKKKTGKIYPVNKLYIIQLNLKFYSFYIINSILYLISLFINKIK